MRFNRLLQIVNVLIAIVVAAALAGVYWFFYRPLPQTSGTIAAPLRAKVTVTRDGLGTPSVRAQNEEDLYFVQGYVTAEDRLWQMDGLRRFSAGDLAEIVGTAALQSDQESRKLRIRKIAESAYLTMPVRDRLQFAAYARGVNHYMETHRNNLSFEFRVLGYEPRPWSVVDGVLVGLYMFRSLTTTWPEKIQKRNLLNGGDAEKIRFLFPSRSGLEILPGGDVQPGSNAWAIGGSRTATGKAMLSNDMHLEYSIPGIWFTADLEAPGMHVAGVSLPGVPGIIVGHNQKIAWGLTNLHFDVQDLYSEKLDDRTGQYLFKGQVEQARGERELILVRGKPPVELRHWVTRHGPVFLENGSERLALKWAAAEPGMFEFPFPEINRATNWQEFTKAVSRLPGPGQNMVYADTAGNIGYHASGKLPIRRTYTGDLPVDGSTGEFEWEGFIPFEQLPSAYNPPNGLIVTANQNPFAADFPYQVTGTFAAPDRSRQIRNLLLATKAIRPADSLRVQKDVYSGFSLFLAHALVSAYDQRKPSNPQLAEAVGYLRGWNGQMEANQVAPFIVTLAFQYIRKSMAEVASPGNGSLYQTQMSVAPVERLLRTRPAGWFADYDQVLLRCLVDAVQEGRRIQGTSMKKWLYGNYLRLLITQPVGHQLPVVAPYFDVGPVPMSGSSTTVKQTTRVLGPSERFNADLANWDNSLLNLPVGESGHVLSRHYKDQWKAYYNATSFPLHFDRREVKSTVEFTPGATR